MADEEEEVGLEISEDVLEGVTEDGDVVIEDVITAVDEETGDAVVDDVVAVGHADGSVEAEEVITAISGEDGSEEIVSDTVTEIDADGNEMSAELE
jgi:hypothetical protein